MIGEAPNTVPHRRVTDGEGLSREDVEAWSVARICNSIDALAASVKRMENIVLVLFGASIMSNPTVLTLLKSLL